MLFDTEKLSSELDMEFICNCFGVRMSRHGKNIFIPCPEHNERVHDNCVISNDGKRYICYSCGGKGDIFDYIRHTHHTDFKEAVKIAAELSGCPEMYAVDSKQKWKTAKRIISYDDCMFLGIHNKPVYGVSCISYEHSTEQDIVSVECGEDNYLYAHLKLSMKNPLLSLAKDNPEAYNELICNKAIEKIELYQQIGQTLNVDVQTHINRAMHLLVEHGGSYKLPDSNSLAEAVKKSESALF